jgi:autotransporter-associated beta strand protein
MKILSRVFMTMLVSLYVMPAIGMNGKPSSSDDDMDWKSARPAAAAAAAPQIVQDGQNRTLILSGSNTYNGSIKIAGGTVTVHEDALENGQLKGQPVELAGGVLRVTDKNGNTVEIYR